MKPTGWISVTNEWYVNTRISFYKKKKKKKQQKVMLMIVIMMITVMIPSRTYSLSKMKMVAKLIASSDKFPTGLVCIYILSSLHRWRLISIFYIPLISASSAVERQVPRPNIVTHEWSSQVIRFGRRNCDVRSGYRTTHMLSFDETRTGKITLVLMHLHVLKFFVCIHGSVHRNSILIRSNKMQQYVDIYLL